MGFQPIAVSGEEIGEQVEAIEGQTSESREVSLYTRNGEVLMRITVTATVDDPLILAVTTAMAVLDKID